MPLIVGSQPEIAQLHLVVFVVAVVWLLWVLDLEPKEEIACKWSLSSVLAEV